MKAKPYTEKPLAKPNEEFQAYTKLMGDSLKHIPKKPASTVQSASTQALMERHKNPEKAEEYEKYRNSPEYMDAIKGITPERIISPDEFIVIEGLRRTSKNTTGQSEKSATTSERKEKAIDAFTYSEPTELTAQQKEKLTKMNAITELETMPKEEKKSFLDLFRRLFETKEPGDTHSYAQLQQFFSDQEKDKK